MRCPVLTSYALPGTEAAYLRGEMPGTDVGYGATRSIYTQLAARGVKDGEGGAGKRSSLSAYALATRSPVLT
eukprot:3878643-Rhodomonas_salina.1